MDSKKYTFENLCWLLTEFEIKGSAKKITPLGNGHINDTYHVQNRLPKYPDYVLQRINHHVFKDVPSLINNISCVTNHLKSKVACVPGAEPEKEVLTLINAKNGESYLQDREGNFWRVYYFLHNTTSYNQVSSAKQAFEAGKAFGLFQTLLSDLNPNLISEIIPDFHNIEWRLKQFAQAMALDPSCRVAGLKNEIDFILSRNSKMTTIMRLGNEGRLPKRITHNDTKFNNVLLNLDDSAKCVIDLDTVMPGYVAYDFGDAVRTIINSANEDEADLGKVKLNIPFFEAFTNGYLKETIKFLSCEEIESLVEGVVLLPYIQAVRFLTDYIEGDKYFRIQFKNHNLQRTRTQLHLVKKLEEMQPGLNDIIHNVAESYRVSINRGL